MSDWQPPAVAPHRAKTPFCGARSHNGSRCDLYLGHVAEQHKDSHTHETWKTPDQG